MIRWCFGDVEYLPVLVCFIFISEIAKTEEECTKLLHSESQDFLSALFQHEEALSLLDKALMAINDKSMSIDEFDPNVAYTRENCGEVCIVPAIFFEWCDSVGYEIDDYLLSALDAYKQTLIAKAYKERTISPNELEALLKEPLWDLRRAVMYLFGYAPHEKDRINDQAIEMDKEMSRVIGYAHDSSLIGKLELHEKFSSCKKVEPIAFMRWAKSLPLSFPTLIDLNPENPKKSKDSPLQTREKETLLKIVIGMAIDGYDYDPKANKSPVPKEISDALLRIGITISDDTIRNKLNEAKEILPRDVD